VYHDNTKLKIHDYFFAETLDKVKHGGIVAFVTSTGTLDKQDESFRQALAQ
jgi:adenine-specific DNA methylase